MSRLHILVAAIILMPYSGLCQQDGTPLSTVLCTESSCPHFYSDGFLYLTARSEDLQVVAGGIVDTGHHIYVFVAAKNITKETNIDVLPERFTLVADTGKGKRSLGYVDPNTVIRGEANPSVWADALDAVAANMAKQTSTVQTTSNATFNSYSTDGTSTNGSINGRSNTTITTPDNQARAAAAARIAQRDAIATQKKAQISASQLRSNTIVPGGTVAGLVFFERDKKADDFELTLPINGKTFVFEIKMH